MKYRWIWIRFVDRKPVKLLQGAGRGVEEKILESLKSNRQGRGTAPSAEPSSMRCGKKNVFIVPRHAEGSEEESIAIQH